MKELQKAIDTLDQHGVYTGVYDSYRVVVEAARLVANPDHVLIQRPNDPFWTYWDESEKDITIDGVVKKVSL